MRRPTAFALIGALLVAASAPVAHAVPARVNAPSNPVAETGTETLRIVSHPFTVLASVTARFVVAVPSLALTNRQNRIEVRVHRRVASRDSLRTIADGAAIPSIIDRHSVRLSDAQRDAGGRVVVDVPVSLSADPRAVVLPFDGVYPVTVAVVDARSGANLASALTFINRRNPATAGAPVATSVVMSLTAPPSIAIDTPTTVSTETRAAVRRVLSVLAETAAPVTLAVQPELVAALAESQDPLDVELFGLLAAQLSTRSVAAAPFMPVDPAVMNALDLVDEWTSQFRLGVATLNRFLPTVTVHTDTLVAATPLDTPTIAMLRRAGVTSLVVLPRAQEGTEAEARPARASHPNGRDNDTVSVVRVDPKVAALLTVPSVSPVVTAHRVAAEIVAERDDQLAAGVDPASIKLAVATSSGAVADAATIAALQRALSGAPGLVASDFAVRTSVTAADPATVFPSTIADPGNNRRGALVAARRELDAVSTMVVDTDPRRDRWVRMLAVGASDQVPDPTAWVSALRAELRAVRQSILVTTPTDITLSSRTTSIRLQLRNDSDSPLIVRLRLSSPKLRLTQPARNVELAPNALTEVVIPAIARTNGRFPVTVRLITPEGGLEVAPLVTITARVTAVAGLGQLVSISLLMVLLAWWWSNRRKARRLSATAGKIAPEPLR